MLEQFTTRIPRPAEPRITLAALHKTLFAWQQDNPGQPLPVFEVEWLPEDEPYLGQMAGFTRRSQFDPVDTIMYPGAMGKVDRFVFPEMNPRVRAAQEQAVERAYGPAPEPEPAIVDSHGQAVTQELVP